MRFEVPQFIEIEDKIIGPLTWKQFIYVAGGSGLCIIFFLSTPFIIAVILSIPIVALAGALAFHRVNNRPFSIFLESVFHFFAHSRLYLWRREEVQSIIEKTEVPETVNTVTENAQRPAETVHMLSRTLKLPPSE